MIDDILEGTLDLAGSSKSGGFALFIIMVGIVLGIAYFVSQSNFKEKCQKVCPTKYKLMEEGTVCACSVDGQWVLKDLGK